MNHHKLLPKKQRRSDPRRGVVNLLFVVRHSDHCGILEPFCDHEGGSETGDPRRFDGLAGGVLGARLVVSREKGFEVRGAVRGIVKWCSKRA